MVRRREIVLWGFCDLSPGYNSVLIKLYPPSTASVIGQLQLQTFHFLCLPACHHKPHFLQSRDDILFADKGYQASLTSNNSSVEFTKFSER